MAKEYQILRQTFDKVIAGSPLDIGGIYYVLKDLFRDVENQYFAQINSELINEAKGGDKDAESVQRECVGELPEREHSAE